MSVPRVLNDRYEIGRLLGRGGMADVYQAHDRRLGRTVAIKVLRSDVARDSLSQARFRREAQAVAGLNHPAIVAVYDTGDHVTEGAEHERGHLPYIVMEYVHGKTLRELIRAKDITTSQALDYTMGILAALDYSHRADIVHRDIKPANVMVTQDSEGALGQVKVMDFGIARAMGDSAATMTQTQTVMGTAQYLSPEQARGESVDARSDLYSAACLLYEMLAGRPPFTGDSPVSVAYQHVSETPPPPSTFNPQISPALDAFLLRALQKDREARFQDAGSFRRALRAAGSGVMPPAAAELPVLDEQATTVVQVVEAPVAGLRYDGEPSSRAEAKALAGGALTTDDVLLPEEPEHPTNRRRRTAWMVTLFVALALILGGGAFVGYTMLNQAPAAVQQESIPSLKDVLEAQALSRLTEMGMKPERTEEFSDTVEAGYVIRTMPEAGTMVDPGTAVKVIVSKGHSEVTLPKDVAGRTDSEIRQLLIDLKLIVDPNEMVNNGQVGANLVVTTDPAPGTSVPVGTHVRMKISTGQVLMPSLIDLTDDPKKVKELVEKKLQDVSEFLQVSYEEVENPVVKPGLVTGQSIAAGTAVEQRATVVVTIAKAPAKEEPTQEPSPDSQSPSPEATEPPKKKD